MTVQFPRPNSKPQTEFFKAKARFIAYGGARGGGKSWSVRYKAALLATRYAGIRILVLRRTFPELQENHILPMRSILNNVATYKEVEKAFNFPNGSRIKFGYCASEGDVNQYQGQEYDIMLQNALSNLQGQQQSEYDQEYKTQQYIDALEQYREQQKQQEIENAMNLTQMLGYVPENFAGALGIDAGTRTADQAYREYQMAQQAAKAVAGTGSGSSGSSKSGGESKMTLTTAKQAASNGVFNDQVLSVLRENGYTDDMLEAIYGYTPPAAVTQEESGMNDAYFTAAMRSVSGALSSGNVNGAQSAIDQIWDRLSPAQQASVSKLIQSYGGVMQ